MNGWTILNYSKVFWISFAKKWGTARTTRNSLTYPICQCPVGQPVTTFIFYLLLQLTEAGLATWNKDKQKLHDRHASHKTNHTTTRNTREPKATLLVHCSKRMKSVVGPAVKYSCHAGWAFSLKAWWTGRPSCRRMGKQGASKLVISTARIVEIHHVVAKQS